MAKVIKISITYKHIPPEVSLSLGRQMGMRIGCFWFNNFHLNRVDGNTMIINTTYKEWQVTILDYMFHHFTSGWTIYGEEPNVHG